MTKQKRAFTDKAHFIADLPLEECMRRLRSLRSDAMKITFSPTSSDQIAFTMQCYEAGCLRVTGDGVLCRWEGTLTRVDCKITPHDGVVRWALVSVISLLIFVPLIPLSMFFVATPLFWPLLLSLFGLGCLWALVFRRSAPPDDTPPNLLRMIDDALK